MANRYNERLMEYERNRDYYDRLQSSAYDLDRQKEELGRDIDKAFQDRTQIMEDPEDKDAFRETKRKAKGNLMKEYQKKRKDVLLRRIRKGLS